MPATPARGDATAPNDLADRASHLYVNENRYWFDTQPSINRVAQDRADGMKPDMVFIVGWRQEDCRLWIRRNPELFGKRQRRK